MKRTMMRIGALAGVATLATVTAAPGFAATVSKGTAAAITIEVAGQGAQDSGKVTATNDGSGQQKTGTSEPAAPAIPTGDTLDLGVLAQDAEARVVNGNGRAAACAGVAGNDGTVLQLGEGFCLTPGDDASIDLGLGSLGELPGVRVPPGELDSILDQLKGALGPIGGMQGQDADNGDDPAISPPDVSDPSQQGSEEQGSEQQQQGSDGLEKELAPLAPGATGGTSADQSSSSSQGSGGFQNASYQPAAADLPEVPGLDPDQVGQAVEEALAEVSDEIGPLGLTGSFGAIQAICNAGPGLSGDASLADAQLRLEGGGQELGVLSLPANPRPNTKLFTDLGDVVSLVLANLRENLNGPLAPADRELEPVKQAIDDIVAEVAPQLAPLEQNILEVTLNKQSRSNGTINVTALDAQVIPAAADQLGASLASVQIGDVSCSAGSAPGGPAAGVTQSNPQVPTVVTSGEPGASDDGLPAGVVGGILALLGATALVGYRRAAGR